MDNRLIRLTVLTSVVFLMGYITNISIKALIKELGLNKDYEFLWTNILLLTIPS